MNVDLRSFIRLRWIARFAIVPVFAAVTVFAQSAASPPTPPAQAPETLAPPAEQVAAHEAGQAPCPPSASMDIPVNATIQAKVTGMLDSSRLKVGKEVWVNVINGLDYPGCTLNAGATLYGHVTAVAGQKNPASSELSLSFDHADCAGRGKREMSMRLIGLMGSSVGSAKLHNAVPLNLHGANRAITDAAKATNFIDDELNPGGPAHTVHIGTVAGMPKVKLDYEGGPGCSAQISSSESSIQLEPGSILFLIVPATP
jgi:hypothetical protein